MASKHKQGSSTPESQLSVDPVARDKQNSKTDKKAVSPLLSPAALMALGLAGAASTVISGESRPSSSPAATDSDAGEMPADLTSATADSVVSEVPGATLLGDQMEALVQQMLGEKSSKVETESIEVALNTVGRGAMAELGLEGAGQSDVIVSDAALAQPASVDGAAVGANSDLVAEDIILAQATTGAAGAGTITPTATAAAGAAGAAGVSTLGILAGVAGLALLVGAGTAKSSPAPTNTPVADTTPPVIQSMTVNSVAKTITLTCDGPLDAAQLPPGSAFKVLIGGVDNPVAAGGVAISGSVVTLTLTNAVTADDVSLTYTDPAGNNTAVIQDASGNDAATTTFTQGVVADGYVRGAQIYIDTDKDGVADDGEKLNGVVTNANGNFFLPSNAPAGSIIAVGGVNIDTGVVNTVALKAPQGSTTVNPLTTLVQAVIAAAPTGTTITSDAASSKVAQALGLTLPEGKTLTNYDPLSAAQGDANALAAQKAAAQVATVLALAFSSQPNGSGAAAVQTVVSNLVTQVNAATPSATVNLENPATVTQLFVNVSGSTAALTAAQTAVAAIEAAATIGAVSAAQSIALDETSPVAPTVDLTAASDTGVNTDNLTSDTTPTLRAALDVTRTDGKAAVAGDTLQVKEGTSIVGSKVVTDADVANGFVDVTLNALPNGSHTLSASLLDKGGNSSDPSASANLTIVIDALAPTLAITSNVGAVKAGETATVSFTFSEVPLGFAAGDVITTGGTLSGLAVTADAKVYTATFTPSAGTASGSANITVAGGSYTDSAGNNGSAGGTPTISIDTVAPTLAITSDVSSVKTGGTANVTFTFSEVPSGFVAGDVITTGGTLSGLAASSDAKVYTALFTPTPGTASGSASITVASAGYTDAAGNSGGAGTTPAISIDTLAPTLVVSSDVSAVKIGGTAAITFTFSENPGTSFAADDITINGGTLGAISGSGLTRTATFTPGENLASGSASITVASASYTDAAGNSGGAGATPAISIDTVAPTLTISSNVSTLKAGEAAGITFTFSEDPGTSFVAGDIALSGGTLSAISGTGPTRTATFTPTANLAAGSASITVLEANYTDAAGNNGGAGSTPTISIDTLVPTVAISSNVTAVKMGEAAAITFSFSEAPTGFSAEDITTTGGDLTNLVATSDANVYTAIFTPAPGTGSGNASITLAGASYKDAAGNNGVAGSTPAISIDTVAPTLAITSTPTTLNASQTATITFAFSEDPGASFDANDVAFTGGTLGAISNSGATRTATFTPTPGVALGEGSISVETGQYTDAAGNTGAGGTSQTISFDTLAPSFIALTPTDGGLTLGLAPNLVFGLSETVVKGSGTVSIFTSTDELVETIDVNGDQVILSGTGANTQISVNPSADLVKGLDYYVKVSSGAFVDLAGNAWAGITDATSWNFTGAGASVVIAAVADDNIVNLAESGQPITITGTLGAEAAILAAYTSESMTAVLQPVNGEGVALTNLTYTYESGTTGTWSGVVAAGALIGVADYTLTVTFNGPPESAASGINGVGTQVVHVDTFVAAPGVALTSDTGSNTSDLITSSGALAKTGVESGATVEYSPDGETNWTSSFSPVSGANTVYVRQTDVAGNTSSPSAAYTFTLDSTAPAAPSLALTSDTGSSGADNITNVGTVVVSGAEANATVEYSTNGGTVWVSGFTPVTGLNSVQVRQTDVAGNISAGSVAYQFTLDTSATAPSVALTADTGTNTSDKTTSNGMVNVVGLESGASWQYSVNGGDFLVGTGTSFSTTGEGSKSVVVKQTDAAGNVSSVSDAYTFVVDTSAVTPTLSLANDTGVNGDGQTTNGMVNVGGLEVGAAWQYSINGGNFLAGTGTSFSTSGSGAQSVVVKQTDVAGNTSPTSTALAFTVDTAAPTVSIAASGGNTTTGAVTFDFTFNEAVTGFDASDVAVVNGTKGALTSTGANTYSLLVTPDASTTPINLTLNVAAAAANDIAGNASTAATQYLASVLYGTAGNDTLTVSSALDHIFLGAGADVIKLASAAGSTVALPDDVLDFGAADKIDLSALLGSAGSGYSASALTDTGAGFVELKNVTLTPDSATNSTIVNFNIAFDSSTIDSSLITAATIDLEYQYGVAIDGVASSPKFGSRDVWQLIQPNLSTADGGTAEQVNGQIALVANTNATNPIITTGNSSTGTVLSVELTLSGLLNNFTVGLQSVAEGGITRITTANNIFHDVLVGIDKTAGVTIGTSGTLEIVTDSGTLGTVGDNQLHLVSNFDANANVTHLQVRYDTNATFGMTAVSDIIAMDFNGNVTANLTPDHLTFI